MAYIYQADIWCDDCGRAICERLQAEGNAPANPDDEYSFDSDEYPKGCGDDEETDCPQHCASHEDCLNAVDGPWGYKIGCLISTNLTMDGAKYVAEAIREDLERGDTNTVACQLWANEFSDYDEVKQAAKDEDDDE